MHQAHVIISPTNKNKKNKGKKSLNGATAEPRKHPLTFIPLLGPNLKIINEPKNVDTWNYQFLFLGEVPSTIMANNNNNLQIVPAIKNVEPQYVEMKVPLYSYGCEKKIKKALSHLRGNSNTNYISFLFFFLIFPAIDDDTYATFSRSPFYCGVRSIVRILTFCDSNLSTLLSF